MHLIHEELFDELAEQGFLVRSSELGENITTSSLALLDLPQGTKLHIGSAAVVKVMGLRNPCVQIHRFRKGLQAAVIGRSSDGKVLRKTGVMGIVVTGGRVSPGDSIVVELPPLPHRELEPV